MEKTTERFNEFKAELIKQGLQTETTVYVKEFYMHNPLNWNTRQSILQQLEAYLKALVENDILSEVKASDMLELTRYDLHQTSVKELVKFYLNIDLKELA